MLLLQILFTKAGCAGFSMAWEHRISFAIDLAANFSYDRVRIMPDIVSKLFLATIGSGCAVKLESEQTPFSRASGRVRSAPLHRIRFGTCFFCLPQTIFYLGKPIENSFQLFLANSFKLFSANRFNLFSAVPYFYSEINGWSKDWVKRWARLWTSQPLVGNNFSPIPLKILFQIKKESDSLLPEINRAFKPFWLSTESVLQELQHVFLRSEQVAALSDCHHLWNALSLYSARAVPERGPKR